MAFTERSSNRNIREEINQLFDSVAVDVTGIEEDILELQDDVTELEAGIAAVGTLVETAQDDINAVETLISTIQTAISAINAAISGIEDDVTAIEGDVTTLQSGLTAVEADIATLESSVGTLQSDLNAAESNITTLQTDLDTAETNITALQATNITGNKTANLVFAAPSSGADAPATFRSLVQADLPFATVQVVSGTSVTVDLAAQGNPKILYLSMTNSAARAVTLPALSAALIGQIIIIKDTANSAASGNVTVSAAGGNSIVGSSTIIVNGNSTRLFALSATQWGSF